MSDGINFCTTILSFFGFGFDTVDFAFQDDPNNPTHRETCCLHNPRFWFWMEKLLLLADIANFIFDIFFINKLREEDEEVWAIVLLCATFTTFIGTMSIGKAVLYLVKKFQPPQGGPTVYKESVYYAYWSCMELAAFLLEDATTIYLYVSIPDIFDPSSVMDVGNLIMSMTSGILSLVALLLMTCSVYFSDGKKCFNNFILFVVSGLFVAYPVYLAIYYLVQENEEDVEGNLPKLALGVSSFFGYFFFSYLLFALCCQYCCADDMIEWPTDHGMYRQRDLGGSHIHVNYGGAGNPSNIIKP